MNKFLISLGGNLGNVNETFDWAWHALEQNNVYILKKSSLYVTSPWGLTDQPPFLNACWVGITAKNVVAFFQCLQQLESLKGRDKSIKWGPRQLDIDLIFWNNDILQLPEIAVPHPRFAERNFVLVPASEIAPGWVDPVSGLKLEQLQKMAKDISLINKSNNA